MRAIIQRVRAAKVTVLNEIVGSIGPGLCVFVGIKNTDSTIDVEYLVRKILSLRLFEGEDNRRWQKSAKDLQLEILCVSQFTLYNRLKGNKPDFSAAMKGHEAQQLYNYFLECLRQSYEASKIQDGRFGAYMQVHIENDGPVTIDLESPEMQEEEYVDK